MKNGLKEWDFCLRLMIFAIHTNLQVLSHACTQKHTYRRICRVRERRNFQILFEKGFGKGFVATAELFSQPLWLSTKSLYTLLSVRFQTNHFLRLSGLDFVTIQFPAQKISQQYDCVHTNTHRETHWHTHLCSQLNMRWQFVLWQPTTKNG